jgi:isopentenyl-diphosphate delta-isomerase
MATEAAQSKNFATIDLSEYDPEQSRLMDERCIVVDENDRAIGALDKKTCEHSSRDMIQRLTLA